MFCLGHTLCSSFNVSTGYEDHSVNQYNLFRGCVEHFPGSLFTHEMFKNAFQVHDAKGSTSKEVLIPTNGSSKLQGASPTILQELAMGAWDPCISICLFR